MTGKKRYSKNRRLSWDEYFMRIAQMVAERSTCLRRKVGAVLVKDKRILSTGYNGAPTGLRHCDETGCLREQLKLKPGERIELCRGLHAEQNAIVQAAAFGIDVSGATLYSTHQPCITCVKILINARIKRICYLTAYPDDLASSLLKEAKIKVERMESGRKGGKNE
ncbi:MAG: cytidine/deoxycytidylate deaminase family protein [candidate division WOR-3 bacterium]